MTALLLLALAAEAPCAPTVTGELQIESFHSAVYGDERTLRIWLPPGYRAPENAGKRYPVLYMLDGQTLFDRCTAFKKEDELRLDETATRLIGEGKLPPLIVVGVDSSGRRTQEYRPYPDPISDPAGPEPRGKELPGFLIKEVLPHVEKRYRISADPTVTGIGGTSLGAVAALYVLLNRPDRFGLGLLESPTLPLGNGQLLRDTDHLARGPDRISIGAGATELAVPGGADFAAKLRMPLATANAGFARMAEALAANLKAAALNRPEVTLVIEPNGNHTSASWARRLPAALLALYGKR